jgi:hypothetical protein
MLLVLTAAMITTGPAHSLVTDPLTPSDRSLLAIQGRIIELQTRERWERRRDFQQQQQYYREQDRLRNQAPLPRSDVPVMRQRCPLRVFGNHYVSNCQRN